MKKSRFPAGALMQDSMDLRYLQLRLQEQAALVKPSTY
jgi:hypothetical protein